MFGQAFLGQVSIAGLGQIPTPQDFDKLIEQLRRAEESGDAELQRYYEHLLEEYLVGRRASLAPRRRTNYTTKARQPISSNWSQRAVPISATAQRQVTATAYRPSRIPTLPFGGSFWGGGVTTSYT